MKRFTAAEARRIGEEIGIEWGSAPFDVEQFRSGLDVELEHGLHDPTTNVTDDDPVTTAGRTWPSASTASSTRRGRRGCQPRRSWLDARSF